jgi:hypothetical protein
MPPIPAPKPEATPDGVIHRALNRRQLVRRLYALAGVRRYGFVLACDQALLLRADPQFWPRLFGSALVELHGVELHGDAADPGLLLALPLAWSGGLVDPEEAPRPEALLANATPVLMGFWPAVPAHQGAILNASVLGQQISCYGALLADEAPLLPAPAVQLLQLERQLRCQLAPACWPAPEALRRPLATADWLAGIPSDPAGLQQLADQLVAVLHLLPPGEQVSYVQGLQAVLVDALDQLDPGPALRLVEALVGGINSRNPALVEVAAALRRAGLARGATLSDPGERGLVLMRLLQALSDEAPPAHLDALAGSIDVLITAVGAAGQPEQKRALQRQLVAIVQSGSCNLPLLRLLLPALEPESGYRLPTLLPPSACLVLVKGVLLLGDALVSRLDRPVRRAMLALLERGLPRLWWQPELLVKLLHDLRRFPLQTRWLLADDAALLPSLVLLHSRGVAPPAPDHGPEPLHLRPLAPEELPGEPEDPRRLLRLQLTLLLRLVRGKEERAALLRLVSGSGKTPVLRLLDGDDEEALVLAAAAALPSRAVSLVRLAADRLGGPELLPVLLPTSGGVEAVFAGCLAQWRQRLEPPGERPTLPITVLITCHRPRLDLLHQALQSLALQSVAVQEVLVVDDGSPVAEAAALAALLESAGEDLALPLRLLRQEHNQGQYACRNLAITQMTGEVLAIHDDDDLSHPLRLELQWQLLQQGAAAVYTRHLRLDEATGTPQADGDGGAFFGDGITTLVLHRQTALALGGFYPVRSRGDVDFRRRLEERYGAARVVRLSAPLYLMRGSATTVSSAFEYGCSLGLPTWRRLMRQGVLP